MTPFERILALLTHRGPLFPLLYQISFFFATQPVILPYLAVDLLMERSPESLICLAFDPVKVMLVLVACQPSSLTTITAAILALTVDRRITWFLHSFGETMVVCFELDRDEMIYFS